ncbi:uncharacterized protein LOC103705663 isoform X2 [Phoenix dactylifera]|uniref:Uncharacterized protein LOC103705663 isoform X2 n=1 Tax=Phoenix dactylifera TaxID=42345 RepID=A0A8B7BZW7_PHODC|nr:uncharacterized protein LOC103705663 isoform X2 [Phoenix dactylifera]
MTTGREAHDGAPAAACGGDAPAPPTAAAAAGVVIEVRSAESECSGGELKDCREEGGKVGGEQEGKGETGVSGTEKAAVVVVDVSAAGGGGWNAEAEKVCRICHLSPDREDLEGSELIQIGCRCKGELGTAHRRCAEAWFKVKGNSSDHGAGVVKFVVHTQKTSLVRKTTVSWKHGMRGECWATTATGAHQRVPVV